AVRFRCLRIVAALALVVTGLAVLGSSPGGALGPAVTTITMEASRPYTPLAPPGATDDYHCTLVNPHVKKNAFIISSHFYPGSPEVHHSIIFLVPPNLASAAEAANKGGNGWTCFGESALPG